MSEFIKRFETNQGLKKVDFQSLGNFPTCAVGQLLKVTAVDGNGQPTAWEAVTPEVAREITDINGLQAALDGKAAASHNHDGTYAAAGHNHDGTYAVAGHNHDGTYAPAYTYGTADLTAGSSALTTGTVHFVYE